MRRIVAYPSRPVSACSLGYNLGGNIDNAHVDFLAAGGATFARTQFAWPSTENYTTGALSLNTAQQSFLSYCASKKVQPVVIAAYGPPYATIGSLTTTADTPANSAAGTSIPVSSYGFTIATSSPICFASSPIESYPTTLTGRWSYYGSLIASASTNAITLAAKTAIDIPSGTTINVQQLRYSSPMTDTDPSNAAFVRYATFLANQIAAAGAQGMVSIWNEYIWPNDLWGATARYYDTPPGGITQTGDMKAVLSLCQSQSLPVGVSFGNGTSEKTGFGGVVVQGVAVPGSIAYDEMHPYAATPEGFAWDYYSTDPVFGANWWEVVDANLYQNGNFNNMARINDITAHSPALMASECGIAEATDSTQARFLARRVASCWGMKTIPVIYDLDGGGTYDVATSLVARQSYTTLQTMMAILGRMAPGNDQSQAPAVVGWGSDLCPLMTTTVHGGTGHSTTFMWQRTSPTTNSYAAWAAIPSPAAVSVSLTLPIGVSVAECLNVRTGAAVTATVTGGVVTVPVSDDVVALRLA